MVFLQATLNDGSKVVSEFQRLDRIERYVNAVYAGQKPFNVWRFEQGTHRHSGEATRTRARRMLNGRDLREIVRVEPTTEQHSYDPQNFRPYTEPAAGELGTYVAPEGQANGLVAGEEYPIHRDPASLGRYVIVRTARGGEPEVRFWLDSALLTDGSGVREPADADEDEDGF